jgi:homoserine trans-succinylase
MENIKRWTSMYSVLDWYKTHVQSPFVYHARMVRVAVTLALYKVD